MIERHETAVSQRIAESEASRRDATRAATKAEDRFARIKRHFQDGRLEPEDWAEQRDELTAELEAARAEERRLAAQEQEMRATLGGRDPEEEVLRFLGDLDASVLGPLRSAETLDGLRAGFRRIFNGFHVYPAGSREAVALAGDLGRNRLIVVPSNTEGRWASSPGDLRVALPVPDNSYAQGLVR